MTSQKQSAPPERKSSDLCAKGRKFFFLLQGDYSGALWFFRKIPYIEKTDCAEPVIIHIFAVDLWKIRKFAEESAAELPVRSGEEYSISRTGMVISYRRTGDGKPSVILNIQEEGFTGQLNKYPGKALKKGCEINKFIHFYEDHSNLLREMIQVYDIMCYLKDRNTDDISDI